jgi:acetyl-CoA carboxylase biotin carboxylase subunit
MRRTKQRPIRRLLVANRSEIACRILRTAREMGIETVAVYSDPDRNARHVALADRAVGLGGDTPATSYLVAARLVEAAKQAGADAVHPGYGFLSENAGFAEAVRKAGLVFVGPSAAAIAQMGDKVKARELAARSGVPLVPSADLSGDRRSDARAAEKLGFPVLVKAAAGGGGRGMRVVTSEDGLAGAIEAAGREAEAAFGDGRLYLEKYLTQPRHVEIQIFGDGRGTLLSLGERECSIQRRHQKVIEEAPSPVVDQELRATIGEAALKVARAVDYEGAGTVEFLLDEDRRYYFLEMNTRLQVEHAVTELVTATDLVRWQLEVAAGGSLQSEPPARRGHAIEARVYAEDPANGFLPTAGRVARVLHPQGPGVRVDSALFDGFEVPVEYDPMLAKVVAWGPDRAQSIRRLHGALGELAILGVTTNVAFLRDVIASPMFARAAFSTATVEREYGSWSRGGREGLEIAAAAAAVVGSAGTSVIRDGADPRAPGPWETLGAWRLGIERS